MTHNMLVNICAIEDWSTLTKEHLGLWETVYCEYNGYVTNDVM